MQAGFLPQFAGLAFFFLATLPLQSGAGTPLNIRYPDGRLEPIETIELDGKEYLSADEVSLLYSASKFWRPDLLKMTLRIGTKHVKVTAENRNVVLDESVIHLLEPVLYREGKICLPVQLVTDFLPSLVEAYPVTWDRDRRILSFGAREITLLGTWLNLLPDGVEVVVRPSIRCETIARVGSDSVLTVLFPGARLAVDTLPVPAEESLLDSLAWTMEGGDTAALHIMLGDSLGDYRITREGRPERIVIRLSDSRLFPEAVKETGNLAILTTPGARRGRANRVVIDPGHGGIDSGCSGSAGLLEKEYVLALAVSLREQLGRDYGIAALLTREGDEDLSLSRRAEIANEAGGAVLISLHINGSSAGDVTGAEVYIHSPGSGVAARIESAIEAAARRYEADLVGGVIDQDFRFIPWEAVQASHLRESDRLARHVQREMGKIKGLASRGVREGPIPVLSGADMPAVLVEVGFGTTDEDERLLLQEGTIDRIAGNLARAIDRFAKGQS